VVHSTLFADSIFRPPFLPRMLTNRCTGPSARDRFVHFLHAIERLVRRRRARTKENGRPIRSKWKEMWGPGLANGLLLDRCPECLIRRNRRAETLENRPSGLANNLILQATEEGRMITVTFETTRFRVQIVGKNAWVEVCEGSRWIFRSQHFLPVTPRALDGDDSATTVLRSAVNHYEKTRDADLTLREALTGTHAVAKPKVSMPRATPTQRFSNQVRPLGSSRLPTRVSSGLQDFRMPVRPPLAGR
jgi:hypothetical protein